MKFSTIVVALASIWAVECASVQDAVADLNSITQMNQHLSTTLSSTGDPTKFSNSFISGLKDIVTKANANANALSQAKAGASKATSFSASEQGQICSAFKKYASTFQDVVHSVSDKAQALKNGPNAKSMASVLQAAEFAEDSYARALISAAPACAADIKSDMKTFVTNLMSAHKVYTSA